MPSAQQKPIANAAGRQRIFVLEKKTGDSANSPNQAHAGQFGLQLKKKNAARRTKG